MIKLSEISLLLTTEIRNKNRAFTVVLPHIRFWHNSIKNSKTTNLKHGSRTLQLLTPSTTLKSASFPQNKICSS